MFTEIRQYDTVGFHRKQTFKNVLEEIGKYNRLYRVGQKISQGV